MTQKKREELKPPAFFVYRFFNHFHWKISM